MLSILRRSLFFVLLCLALCAAAQTPIQIDDRWELLVDRDLIEQMLHRVTQKLLHKPVELLNTDPADGATRIPEAASHNRIGPPA